MLRAGVEELWELHARFFCLFLVLQINLFCSLHFLYHYCNEKILDGLAIHPNPPRIRIPHLTSSWVSKCSKIGPVSVGNTSRKANLQNLTEGHVQDFYKSISKWVGFTLSQTWNDDDSRRTIMVDVISIEQGYESGIVHQSVLPNHVHVESNKPRGGVIIVVITSITFLAWVGLSGSHCSSRPFCLNFTSPRCLACRSKSSSE